MARKALLLGVDAYEESSLRLPAAGRDTKDLAAALVLAGFAPDQVTSLVGSKGEYLSTKNLRKHIRQFLEAGQPADELLIYFSGHGVEWDGRRLLIPQDYDPADPSPRHDLIGDTDLYALARRSGADSAIIVIDACRQDIRLEVVDNKGPEAPPPQPGAETPSIAFLLSCAAGEFSQAATGADASSYFTRALCEALTAEDAFDTLGDVCAAVQTRLDARLAPLGLHQTVTLSELRAEGRGGDPLKLVIKESPAARLRQQIDRSHWVRLATRGPIWDLAAGASQGFADQLRTLIQRAEAIHHQARERLPRQRWGDDAAPARILRRLEVLLDGAAAAFLTPAEAAAVIAVPHLYEAILAAAQLRLLANGDPLTPADFGPDACRMALALRNRVASEAAWERRRALLRGRGLDAAADDLAAWQLLRFLHESGELWDYAPGQPAGARRWANEALDTVLAPAPLPAVAADARVPRVLDGARLVALVRLAFAGFDDIGLEERRDGPQGLERNRSFGEGTAQCCLDEVKLAHLLNLAFGMALDARRLPPVLAEHLGVDAPVTAAFLAQTLTKAEWHRDGSGLTLALDCPHEALDAALETHVATLGEHLHRLAREEVLPADLIANLPRRLGDGSVRPAQDPEAPRYSRPHLTFTLDQARVRELLMGETLYGKPELALRELYQNALDACRYRRTRERWLRAQGKLSDDTPVYRGLIRFRAGKEDGRSFIECEDNGIGMAERHLRGLFARAGRRFADSHEFHLELADWDAAGIPFYPNSRFGIGVFSYFMLADEVLVESRRLDANGVDCEAGIRARVVGSGSLFRVQPLRDTLKGTRIRRYLNRADADPAKLLDEIVEWLWVPEFETEIIGTQVLRLAAGEPGPGMVNECGALAPIPESVGNSLQARVWWSGALIQHFLSGREFIGRQDCGPGRLLSDGILVQRTDDDSDLTGLVLNLTEALRPALSVDRNQITDWSDARSWLHALLLEHGWRNVAEVANIRP
ncbi:caspase family protein [uncultured Thiodictyon sp.]|uniref:caspase family protein n=1 Tax=uncultured Thiodictyon sp. TaxID=1846217 RepID=UPI0025D1A7CC|nr:caspase family protein [uncultured Thiodictyon sp.]